jgi:hypothetical protein
MRDREIDEILKRAAGASPDVDPALVDRLSRSIGSSLGPVRPLPPARVLASGLFVICGAVALAGAALLGLHGIAKLSGLGIALIFPVLAAFTWLAAMATIAGMTPGSRRPMAPALLLAGGCTLLVAVFALLFPDYRTHGFVHQGIACLTAGLLIALPAGLAGWIVVRRGFAVNPVAAGLAMGTLAGLAGVTMLELHCANFEAPHVMVWHTAVIPLSALAGAAVGRAARLWSGRRGVAMPR